MQNLTSTIAIRSIDYYQRNLSHKKSSRCAHRALHNGSSCSAYSKERIQAVGSVKGILDTLRRFKACYKASLILQQNQNHDNLPPDTKQSQRNKSDVYLDGCFGALLAHDAACCLFSILS
jgi:putative component of membrane protein insertase Oxa1/YidC/SpoIIIJ protein YidD